MAICLWCDYPDLFITMICNPKWPQIQHLLEYVEGQNVGDHPDSIARVFKIRLHELMRDLKENQHFGRTMASELYYSDSSFIH